MKPLHGCRVLDLGIITAGAATSALLADLGAEVIKIESETYRDPFRQWSSAFTPMPGDDLPPFFRMTNRGKSSVSLDLKAASGRAAFLRLAANSDVVVENFSRGVLARLGIGYDALRAVRPEIILASISSQGETGPDARYASFGSTLEAVAGMAWLTGYPDGPPTVSGIEVNYPDQVVALFAAGAIVSAWYARQSTGQGAHLDLSQRDLTTYLCGDAFAEPGATRAGNAQPPYLVQDCFVCAGDAWVAVSVLAQHAGALAAVVGLPEGCGEAALRDGLARQAAMMPAADFLRLLRDSGVTASPVLDAGRVLEGMGTDWRLALQTMPDGRLVKGFPFQFEATPLDVGADAVPLGTHTREVLARVAGMSPSEIKALIEAGVAAVAGPVGQIA